MIEAILSGLRPRVHRSELPLRLLTRKGGRCDHNAINRSPRPRATFGGPAGVAPSARKRTLNRALRRRSQ
jgi:hypothetical protein